MKTRLVVLLLLSVGLLSASGVQNIQAQTGMSVMITTSDGTDITISGVTTITDDVSVKVVNSSTSTILFVGQKAPNQDGTYSFYSSTDSQGWPEDGIYRVTAKQKNSAAYNLNVSIKVEDGRIITDNVTKSSLNLPVELDVNEQHISGLMIDVTADPGSSIIIIDGTTTSQANAVTILVTSPTGNKVHSDQINPSSGSFNADINLGCPHWEESGIYTITVQQGSNNLFKKTASVEIDQCLVVPEFGAIAMAILVVSIVAIVILGARSRTSIMQTY